jgi:hypothetical protein
VIKLLDEIGFDAVDAGSLDESWRFERAKPAYCIPLDKEAEGCLGGGSSAGRIARGIVAPLTSPQPAGSREGLGGRAQMRQLGSGVCAGSDVGVVIG